MIRALARLVDCLLGGSDQGGTMLAFRQQLQQSGLWEALPGMLSSAARALEQCAAEPAQLAALQQAGDEPGKPLVFLLMYVGDLFTLQQSLVKLWDAPSLLQSPAGQQRRYYYAIGCSSSTVHLQLP